MKLVELEVADPGHRQAAVELWNEACGPALEISPHLVSYNMRPAPGAVIAGRLAEDAGQPVGFVLACALQGEPAVNSAGDGWIDAIAVKPAMQQRGAGAQLMDWAEDWLAAQGCTRVRIGGGLRPFVPGVPVELGSAGFFRKRGYAGFRSVWDMAANLATYNSPSWLHEVDAAVRPAQVGQEELLLGFLRREFPGRWRYEAEMLLADGGRISDYMLLWSERGVDGVCLVTFQDSLRPIERFYPYTLPKPWGQVGSIGISADRRGQGLGAALLDGALRRLHNNGVNGCIIDWTDLVAFYARFGFAQYREYVCPARALT
ncbi:MAG: GNAT family N-acetyltransferase [Caldilineaceae bacterium]|nr:GNAT family N-acetyltransferase [Caldilineaceae bacterium]